MFRAHPVEWTRRPVSERRSSRHLRQHLIVLALLSGSCVLVWALSGGGTFWPAAVMLLAVAGVTIDVASRLRGGPSGRLDELEPQLRASSRK